MTSNKYSLSLTSFKCNIFGIAKKDNFSTIIQDIIVGHMHAFNILFKPLTD